MILTLNTDIREYVLRYGDPDNLEVVPWCIYDAEPLENGQEKHLSFFQRGHKYESCCATNQWIPGMLPNPMAFSIEKVRIFGVASDIALANFRMDIGNKIVMDRPLWTATLRECFIVRPTIFIAPLQYYRATIQWDGKIELGRGLSGKPIRQRLIQVALFGQVARARQ